MSGFALAALNALSGSGGRKYERVVAKAVVFCFIRGMLEARPKRLKNKIENLLLGNGFKFGVGIGGENYSVSCNLEKISEDSEFYGASLKSNRSNQTAVILTLRTGVVVNYYENPLLMAANGGDVGYGSEKLTSLENVSKTISEQECEDLIRKALSLFDVVSFIADPGFLELTWGDIFIGTRRTNPVFPNNGSAFNINYMINAFAGLRFYDLDAEKVYSYLMGCQGLMYGFPSSGIERGILYFIKALNEREYSAHAKLLWSIAGIEAILGEKSGQGSITRILKQKIDILLSDRIEGIDLESEFSDLYKERSKIVHGDVAMFCDLNQDSNGGTSSKSHHTIALALLTLILQKIIEKGWRKLEFTMVLDET